MGLDQLDGMDVPDNKGGRPSKDEQEDSHGRSVTGDPYTMNKGGEDWWQEKFSMFSDEHDDIQDVIIAVAEHVEIYPLEVRLKLEEYGVHDTDWQWYADEYPMYKKDMRIQHKLKEAGVDVPASVSSSSSSSSGSQLFDDLPSESTSSSDEDVSGGLSSLIDE